MNATTLRDPTQQTTDEFVRPLQVVHVERLEPNDLLGLGLQRVHVALQPAHEHDRGLFRVEIIGGASPDAPELMKRLQLRLITGKRESLWANGPVVKEIRIRQVEEATEDT